MVDEIFEARSYGADRLNINGRALPMLLGQPSIKIQSRLQDGAPLVRCGLVGVDSDGDLNIADRLGRLVTAPGDGDTLIEKGKAERTLRDSGRPYTIIRSGAILWSPDRGMIPYTGEGYLTEDTLHVGPTTYDDLGVLVADCALNPACMNKEFHATDDTRDDDYAHWRCRRFRSTPDEVC